MTLIDSHCHLEGEDAGEVVARAKAAGLGHAVVVGQWQRRGDFGAALALASAHPGFLTPTMGLHPHDAAGAQEADLAELERLCALPEVVAVGETGLDFYYDRSPRPEQERIFRLHCRLARKLSKPVVVHVRDAHPECHRVLREEGVSRGIIHCFSGDVAAARSYLDLGLHLSVSGVITYPKTEELRAAVAYAPMDRLLVETDSPYLAPIPHRGKRNEPAFVVEVARKVGELKGLPLEEVALLTARNTVSVLGLKLAISR